MIRAHQAEAERERRVFPSVLAALLEGGLLRMFTPRSMGGLEADPLTRALAIEEISGHDTSAGWTLANPLDQAYLGARLPDAGVEEIYGRGAHVVPGNLAARCRLSRLHGSIVSPGVPPSSATAMRPTGLPWKPR